MADSSRTIMTDAGFALETRVRADETKMQFTRAAISTDDHFSDTDDALAKLTELYNIQQDGKVTAVQVINTTTVYVQVDVNQAESKADYQMRSAALYAKDDDGTEVLYGVTVLQDPVFVHKDADGSYLGFGINTTVGKASNVVVVVDPANMVTQQVFEGTMKNYYTKAEVDAKFVTDDDFASKLPQNIATTDAANTFAKSQTLAGGATDGKGNAYATTKDVATGLNNGLSTKVNATDTANWQKQAMFNPGNYNIDGTNQTTDFATLLRSKYNKAGVVYIRDNDWPSNASPVDAVVICEGGSWWYAYGVTPNGNFVHRRIRESDDTGWVINADDSKVVHSTDMRKPASDVAGIEEVNTKQDKIGYTPANDSKVVHNSGDETIGGTKTFTNPIKGTIDGITYRYSAVGDDLNTSYMNDSVIFVNTNKVANSPAGTDGTWAIVRNYNSNATNGAQSYYDTNHGELYFRTRNNNTEYSPWIQVADDSKVAHLSGANNFDTVPTVNNNPLLLASSLPSDLARLSQDANFTAKLQQNGQDVALANNTIARNPDTSAVVDSVNFTGTAQKSGSSILAQSDWVKSDNDSDAKTASSNNLEGFYYTEG